MAWTDIVLSLSIAALLLLALYIEVVLPQRKGSTLLRVMLRRRHLADSTIFIGLLLILLWKNLSNQGPQLTTTLLLLLCALTFWLFWLRRPALLMKSTGLFYASIWIDYRRIAAINLSEDGILLMQLEQRQLFIAVRDADDLQRIWQTLVTVR